MEAKHETLPPSLSSSLTRFYLYPHPLIYPWVLLLIFHCSNRRLPMSQATHQHLFPMSQPTWARLTNMTPQRPPLSPTTTPTFNSATQATQTPARSFRMKWPPRLTFSGWPFLCLLPNPSWTMSIHDGFPYEGWCPKLVQIDASKQPPYSLGVLYRFPLFWSLLLPTPITKQNYSSCT